MDEQKITLAEIKSDFNGNCFAQIMGGAWVPIQSSLIQSRAFFEIGRFNPLICATEDEDLYRRAAYHGDFANTQKAVACLLRGQTWSKSTNYLCAPEDVKYSRNLFLSRSGAFQRLRKSARSSYWHGRALRVYLSTVAWNLKQKNLLISLSRIFFSLSYLLLSFRHLPSSEYWNGVRADHVSPK